MKSFIAFLLGISICNASNELSRDGDNIEPIRSNISKAGVEKFYLGYDCRRDDERILFSKLISPPFYNIATPFYFDYALLLAHVRIMYTSLVAPVIKLKWSSYISHKAENKIKIDKSRYADKKSEGPIGIKFEFKEIMWGKPINFHLKNVDAFQNHLFEELKKLLDDNEGIKNQKTSIFLDNDPYPFEFSGYIKGCFFDFSKGLTLKKSESKRTEIFPSPDIVINQIFPFLGDISTLLNFLHLSSEIRKEIINNEEDLFEPFFKSNLPLYTQEKISLQIYLDIKKLHKEIIDRFELMLERMGSNFEDKKVIDNLLNKLSELYSGTSLSGKTVKKMKELSEKKFK